MPASAEQFIGSKRFFKIVAGSVVPVNIKPDVPCIGVVMFNEGPSPVRIGNPSGTLNSNGSILLPSGVYFRDDYSDDAWWAISTTSSGTVSGYYVEP